MNTQFTAADLAKFNWFHNQVNRTVAAIQTCDQKEAERIAWQIFSNYPDDYGFYTEKVNERLFRQEVTLEGQS